MNALWTGTGLTVIALSALISALAGRQGKPAATPPEPPGSSTAAAAPAGDPALDQLRRELEAKQLRIERLSSEIEELRAKLDAAETEEVKPQAIYPAPTHVPIYFPEQKRLLGTGTLFWQPLGEDDSAPPKRWSPVVFLPPGARSVFTEVVTNFVERPVDRDVTYNYNYPYPYYYNYPVYRFRSNGGEAPPAPSPPGRQNPRLSPPELPRAGRDEGFPPPLPRAGIPNPGRFQPGPLR